MRRKHHGCVDRPAHAHNGLDPEISSISMAGSLTLSLPRTFSKFQLMSPG